ncbi:FOG: Transposon-encoded proteins with TYA, reverse transcriptase, integrase domains in various combinations [Plasmopara halstedii]|uniref:FOG: Transposon-encoded proteins with TYA, reverse transcriptase, integrase domains in various combinations n=1 Tax=Plasmopara halstedii TaxID=4781 RepID=A0A0N7L461_PLAHL|nr:FOG: Transposon-encoded proteins with TYA, reverse transcriptase, integrase domains in various combinations [Plasmopara halstedii]CEG37779.1 FOG: Transposon-encoded proteins with TYA, reverse transcriptase, integrase domains in various combinations [Plasmopara halstedii]|eukprot:XP_024574148.1 FOG: Transposon-encoded proteins with TYA, reverse transcriptase, integrase domains in various combinations [Plasmopara halstedii]
MTPYRDDLFENEVVNTNVEVAFSDGKKPRVAGTGSVCLKGIDGKRIQMMEVLHIPRLDRRLLSVGEIGRTRVKRRIPTGFVCYLGQVDCDCLGEETHQGLRIGLLAGNDAIRRVQGVSESVGSEACLHEAPHEVAYAKTQRATTGMPVVKQGVKTLNGGCMKGKQTVAHISSRSLSKSSRVLVLVHTDVMGPMKTKSKDGAKYMFTFVDDHSRFVVEYFLKKTSEVVTKFNAYKRCTRTSGVSELR